MHAYFNTDGSTFDTTLTVYSSSSSASFASLTLVTENDDSPYGLPSEVDFNASPSLTYYIDLDGFMGDTGSYVFKTGSLNPANTPVPSVTSATTTVAGAQNGAVNTGDTVTVTIHLSEAVSLSSGGTAVLHLSNGIDLTTSVIGSDGQSLVFAYTVSPGHDATDLQATTLTLTAGTTLRDAANQDADLSGFTVTDTGLRVDTVLPTATSISPGSSGPTNATSLTFTVSFSEAVAGVTATAFTLHHADGSLATGTIGTPTSQDGGLTYHVTATGLTDEGAVRLDLNATGTGIQDTAGNAIAGSFTGSSATLDHTLPTLSLAASAGRGVPANQPLITDVQGHLVLNAAEFASSLFVSGTSSDANPGPGVVVRFTATDGHSVPDKPVALTNGAYAFRIDAPGTAGNPNSGLAAALTDGTYAVTATTQDAAGNLAATSGQTLVVDTTADAGTPASLMVSDTADHVINAAEARAVGFAVAGLDSDATAIASFSNGTHTIAAAVTADGTGVVDLSGFNGTLTASLAITDVHQNTTAVAGNSVQADTLAPAIPTLALVHDTGTSGTDGLTRDASLVVTSVEAGASLSYGVDGHAIATYDPASLGDGAHTLAVTQTDAAGNVSGATSFSFILDRLAPGAQADTASATGLSVPLTGNVLANDADASALHLDSLRFADGAAVGVPGTGTTQISGTHGTLTVSADGHYSYYPTSAGHDAFIETVVDAAGNASQTTLTFDVDHAQRPAFRFYDTSTQDHFFTTDAVETAAVKGLPDFVAEGSPWTTPDEGADTVEVFRFYDTTTRDHFLTASTAERDVLIRDQPSLQYEGVAFQSYATAGADGTFALERFYNTGSHAHMYAAEDEAALIRSGQIGQGWVDDGQAFIVHAPMSDLHA